MMGNASAGRTLPEQRLPNDDRRNMVYSMANASRDQKIARDVMAMIENIIERNADKYEECRGAEARPQ
eukprot:9639686-Heterocapsa_arctica.AAC.1